MIGKVGAERHARAMLGMLVGEKLASQSSACPLSLQRGMKWMDSLFHNELKQTYFSVRGNSGAGKQRRRTLTIAEAIW